MTPALAPLSIDPDHQPHHDGVPVVVLHGIAGAGSLFDGLGAALAPRYRLIAPDLRAHGENRDVDGDLDAESVAESLVPLLDAAGITDIHLIGHSHGGATAQALARLLPERVCSLMLVSTYAFQPLTPRERLGGLLIPRVVRLLGARAIATMVRVTRTAGGGRRLDHATAKGLAAVIAGNDPGRTAEAFIRARRFDSRPWLHELRMPTLVVTGKADHMVSPKQSAILATRVGDGYLRHLDDAGHMLPLSHPEAFAQIVRPWLDQQDAGDRRSATGTPFGLTRDGTPSAGSAPRVVRRRTGSSR